MRTKLAAVPKGDSLCLFCASWLAGGPSPALRRPSRPNKRSYHVSQRLYQSSSNAAAPKLDASAGAGFGQTDRKQEKGSGAWGQAGAGTGGWGGSDSSSIWETSTKVLGKDEEGAPRSNDSQTTQEPRRFGQGRGQRFVPRAKQSTSDEDGYRARRVDLHNQQGRPAGSGEAPQQSELRFRNRTNTGAPFKPQDSHSERERSERGGPRSNATAYSLWGSQPSDRSTPQQGRFNAPGARRPYQRDSTGDSSSNLGVTRSRDENLNPFSHRLNLSKDDPADDSPQHRAHARNAANDSGPTSRRLDLSKEPATQGAGTITDQRPGNESKWGHLRFNRPNSAHPQPVTPDPAVVRLKEEQEQRMKHAQAGNLTGWGNATDFDWDAAVQKHSQAPESRQVSPDQQGPRPFRRTQTSSKPSVWDAESEEVDSLWDAAIKDRERGPITPKPVDGAESPNAPQQDSRPRRRDRFDTGRSMPQERYDSRQKVRRNTTRERGDDDGENISDEALERMERREKRKAEKAKRKGEAPPTPIVLPDFISIGNLAALLHVRVEQFSDKLEELGFGQLSSDHILGSEDAGLIAQEFNFEPTVAPADDTREDIVAAPEPAAEDKELMLNRPPVITIMGHVDHGKTTLLDFLRKSSVAAGEHGGITQHIGAFTVEMSSGRTITFLDTPGHSAFLEMRQRGANVTDIVILVVAADDSVKPQTLEAIKHAKGADVPVIVAISKIDKEDADPDRVKRDLAQHGVEVEDFGGDVQAIPVSGKTGQGMEDLEDAAIALADILDVRADTSGNVEGWVLESKLKPQGRVATVLMKKGTLRPGAILVAGTTWTKVRTVRNEAGQIVNEATPGQPVEIDGWDDTPEAGAEALEAPNMQRARDVCELREERIEAEKLAATVAATNEQRVEHRAQRAILKEQEQLAKSDDVDGERAAELDAAAELAASNATSKFIRAPVIVRADVAGSAEAVSAAILGMGNGDISALILREEVGTIAASDIELAETAQGVIVNFGLSIPNDMRRMAEQKGVRIIDGNVIYRITDAVKEYLEDKLPPLRTTRVLGEAEILQVFQYKVKGRGLVPIAGCRVTNGAVEKGKNVKVFRAGQLVHDGVLTSLKNHQRDVDTMQKGTECGMGFDKFTEFEAGDKIQSYEVTEEKRKL